MRVTSKHTCIEACMACVAACDHCAASCLREDSVNDMARCIELDLECTAICLALARLIQLESNHTTKLARLCADVCLSCAAECEKHHHDHCIECAAKCRECAKECNRLAA